MIFGPLRNASVVEQHQTGTAHWRIYSRIHRQIFAAGASVFDLAKDALHFSRQGRHLLGWNFNEKRQVVWTLL